MTDPAKLKPRSSFGFIVVVAALVIAGGVGLSSQWTKTMELRGEAERLRTEAAELARLRTENQRLQEKQIPAAVLETLRADHVALPQLRAELEALKQPPAARR